MASVVYPTTDTDLNDDDQNIDALIMGNAWDISVSNILTYSFPDSVGDFGYVLANGATFHSAFDTLQRAAAVDVMAMVASLTGLAFSEVNGGVGDPDDGTIRFFNVTGINTAYGYYPNTGESGGDMAFKAGGYLGSDMTPGTYEFHTVMHELGHALGLKHGQETWGPGAMTAAFDSMEYSVMTYRSFVGHDLNALPYYTNQTDSYAQTFMMMDIAALQRLYGANWSTNSSDSVYTFDPTTGEMSINGVGQGAPSGNKIFRTIWDGNGVDTYDFSNYDTRLNIDLTPGGYVDLDTLGNAQRAQLNVYGTEWARGHIFNALQYNGDARSLIENAEGGSNRDTIIGNSARNVLLGNGKGDKLLGEDGNDVLRGGGGNDRLFGGKNNDRLSGGSGRDKLNGGSGKDTLNGGKKDDTLIGGGGNDTFIFSLNTAVDTVMDFTTGDRLDFTAFGFATFQDVLDTLVGPLNAIAEFDLGNGDRVILAGVTGDSLTVDDILI